jgi:hypothetical protein
LINSEKAYEAIAFELDSTATLGCATTHACLSLPRHLPRWLINSENAFEAIAFEFGSTATLGCVVFGVIRRTQENKKGK